MEKIQDESDPTMLFFYSVCSRSACVQKYLEKKDALSFIYLTFYKYNPRAGVGRLSLINQVIRERKKV